MHTNLATGKIGDRIHRGADERCCYLRDDGVTVSAQPSHAAG